jgi:mycothiol synthase
VEHLLERPRLADADEMLALANACDVAAVGAPDVTAGEIQAWFDSPFTKPDVDGWIVREASGRLVGGAYIASSYGGRSDIGLVYVRPQADPALYRPLVDLLVQRSGERAAEAGRADHNLVVWCTNEPRLARTAAEVGARKARTYAVMRRELDGSEGAVPVPEGVTISGIDYEDEGRMREFHAVYLASFEGHYNFNPSTYEAWRAHVAAAANTPYDQWLIATVDGAIVGVMQAGDVSADGGGLIWILGVLKEFRGRGIAKALLDQAFAVFRAHGLVRAGLGVDVDNDTGAYRLYESLGMRVLHTADAWELTVPAVDVTPLG